MLDVTDSIHTNVIDTNSSHNEYNDTNTITTLDQSHSHNSMISLSKRHGTLTLPVKHSPLKDMALNQPRAFGGMQIFEPLVVCAEPGMGKSYLAGWIMHCAKNEGWSIHQYSFEDLSGEKAARRVVRVCRDMVRRLTEGEQVLLVIDGLAAGDDWESACEARAIERVHDAGGRVVICIRPEGEQLVDELAVCQCLRSEDLRFRTDSLDTTEWDLTGGVPSLVMALQSGGLTEVDGPGARYLMALSDLVSQMLRPELPEEDNLLRIAAILLGDGTMDELACAAGRCDAEQFAWLDRDVPLFEIDVAARRFAVHGLQNTTILSSCLSALQSYAALHPTVVSKVCSILASRQSAKRSAIICALCSSEYDFCSVATSWGVAYVEVGEVSLAKKALRVAKSLHCSLDVRGRLTKTVVEALAGTPQQFLAASGEMGTLWLASYQERRLFQRAQMICACRDIWQNPQKVRDVTDMVPDDETGLSLMEHLRMARLLVCGRHAEVYAAISNEIMLRKVDGLASALLCDDLMLSLMLSGGVPDARERRLFSEADRFFANAHLDRVRSYHVACAAIPPVLMGSSQATPALEEAAARADRAGDRFVQALCLLVMAVGDLRLRAWSRAHVRSDKAAEMARELGVDHLASAASLMDALAVEMLGEHGALVAWYRDEGHPKELRLLGGLAAREAGELTDDEMGFVDIASEPCPRDAIWVLNVLTSDCQSLSKSIVEGLPNPWTDRLRAVRVRQAALLDAAEDSTPLREAMPRPKSVLGEGMQTQMPVQATTAARIRISVLGGFCVEVDGRLLPDSMFERRRSRDLIVLLAIVSGHRLRRYQVIDILWPDSDYYRGPRKLYEATGEARKQLCCHLGGANPLVADRLQGTIGFDVALVDSDVDEFEREARMTLSEDGDDFWVLDHARRMERIYATGPDPHLAALGERVVERIEELKALYVDAMVAAGEAALRLGRAKLAVRYAYDAHHMHGLREDVVILLVQALRMAGRSFEVAPVYRQYSRHLIEEEGIPPSLALRRAVALAAEDGPEALSA